MKKETTMRYLRGELLMIAALLLLLLVVMAGLMYADVQSGLVQEWASSFYYNLVRL